MATNFGTKLTITRLPWKIIASCFHLPPFRARAIWWYHWNFSLDDPCCHGNEFSDKNDYNSAPVKNNCALFAPTPYFRAKAIRWCHLNLSHDDLCCHGDEFWDKIHYNSDPKKIIASCFHLHLSIRRQRQMCIRDRIYPMTTFVAMATNFETKFTITRTRKR